MPERSQVFCFSTLIVLVVSLEQGPSQLVSEPSPQSLGEPVTSRADAAAGPSDFEAHDEQHAGDLGYEDTSAQYSEPSADTTEAGQPGQRELIQPEPLEREPEDEEPGAVIHLPDLQTTQRFVDALKTASLEDSGMQPEDIDSLRDPGPVLDLEDPSPLL